MVRAAALAVVLLVLGGACAIFAEPVPPGTRPWPARVKNADSVPIELAVQIPAGAVPGSRALPGAVQPATVPAGATQDVIFYLPPGQDYDITLTGTTPMFSGTTPMFPGTDVVQYLKTGCRLDMEVSLSGAGSIGCSTLGQP